MYWHNSHRFISIFKCHAFLNKYAIVFFTIVVPVRRIIITSLLTQYTQVNSGSDIPFLGYGLLSGIAGVLALSLPETRGKRIINEIEEAHSQEDSDVD